MKLSGLLLLACVATTAFANENGAIKIYDAKFEPELLALTRPGRLVLEDGSKKALFIPKDAYAADENITKVRDYYFEKFGRKSWDDKGADIIASINVNRLFSPLDITGQKQNAAWAKTRFIFGAGSKKGIDNMVNALDVIGHEYTHAIVQTTSNLAYESQSGALNEHLADVFGVIINSHYNSPKNPYLIGSTILFGEYAQKAEALRDLMDPSKGLTPQPGHMKELKVLPYSKFANGCVPSAENDRCGVHTLSGIPSRMAALVMSAITPEAAAPLFYNVMTKRLTASSNFADYRAALMLECKSMASDTCFIVDNALKSVGM